VNPTYDFAGQVALVTGAAAGMGFDTARAFAASGAAVVLADVDVSALRAATDKLTAGGQRALAVTCDVADEDQVAALVDRTVAEFGRLDMAFNNAGVMPPQTESRRCFRGRIPTSQDAVTSRPPAISSAI
jgi:NAD(P)-dependent dehydrogenase (short-subunit alcohol dehydrogenase family)